MTKVETEHRPLASVGVDRFLLALIVLGIALNCWVFFLPYNTIADEEEYLSEVLSIAAGEPDGWGIRSFAQPAVLSLGVVVAKSLGASAPGQLVLAARLTCWAYWWLGLWMTYRVAGRLGGRRVALLSVVLLVFNWTWMLSSKRLMMDVPAAVWILVAIELAFRADISKRALAGSVLAAGMACATKFQMGPPAVAIVGMMLVWHAAMRRWMSLVVIALTAIAFIVLFGALDFAVYGRFLSSLLDFVDYSFRATGEFAEKYGACEPASFYFGALRVVFSIIIPVFLLFGVLVSLWKIRAQTYQMVLVAAIAYIAATNMLCHKQARYLLAIAPLLLMLTAVGINAVAEAVRGFKATTRMRALLADAGLAAVIVAILASLVPRNELPAVFGLKESCASFVYSKVLPEARKRGYRSLGLAVPCGMPNYPLGEFSLIFGDLGFNDYTRKRETDKFRGALASIPVVVVERNSSFDNLVRETWGDEASLVTESEMATYLLYERKRTP